MIPPGEYSVVSLVASAKSASITSIKRTAPVIISEPIGNVFSTIKRGFATPIDAPDKSTAL